MFAETNPLFYPIYIRGNDSGAIRGGRHGAATRSAFREHATHSPRLRRDWVSMLPRRDFLRGRLMKGG